LARFGWTSLFFVTHVCKIIYKRFGVAEGAFGHFKVVSETARKFKRALFRAFFGEGLEEKRRPPAEAETRAEAGRRETWRCVDAWG